MTHMKIVITTSRDCGSAKWINTTHLKLEAFPRGILERLSLDHDLLAFGLDAGQREKLGLENHGLLLGAQLQVRVQLLAPFDLH